MKKLLTVVLAIAMIASIACVAASAASTGKIVAGSVTVEEGTAVADVKVSFADLSKKIKAATATIEVTGGATMTPIALDENGDATDDPEEIAMIAPVHDRILTSGILGWADLSEDGTTTGFVWVDPMGATDSTDLFTLKVNIPEDAKAGDTYEVKIGLTTEPESYLDSSQNEMEMTAVNATITVIAKTIITDKPTDEVTDAPDTDEPTQAPTDAPDTDAPVTDAPTQAPTNNGGQSAPSTGDAAIVVVVAMVVALGTAIVVKKVNVK